MWDFNVNQILIDQLEKGNEKAFSFLVYNYNHSLCVYANSLINDRERAQDIVQNVFISIWEKRKTLKNDLSIKRFMYRSVYNEFIDQYRSVKSVLALEKLYVDTLLQFEMESEMEGKEKLIKMVMDAIEELPPKCRYIFVMSKKEGLSHIEIAEYLDISTKTVENQITKAFSILREKLGKKYEMILMIILGYNENKTS